MLIVMKQDATPDEIQGVSRAIEARGFKAHPIPGAQRTAIGVTGNRGAVDQPVFESLPGVFEVIPVTHGYKLVSREVKPEDTIVEIGDVRVGGRELVIAAGPCAVESLEQVLTVARGVKEAGARLLRGGAFKPRTSPYSFQGLGEEGLKILAAAREETGLAVVTEVLDPEGVDLVEHYADVIQIGARNMQNFSLLKRCGKAGKPVLLKRGLAATLEEFLMSAEYILAEGNYDVILCERGVRTFSDFSRNTLDLAVVPAVKTRSHLPIVVDPSHGTGRRDKVRAMSRGAVAVGADGLLVEVHHDPDTALSDGPQSLTPKMFATLMGELRQIAPVIGREL
ncbi:MAG: 3-deoxy-7-phosphoheptulonate synthase [Acidobacteria bacterium]|nr:3-deoxy-7-phosphoheptulonate synthase [Acidobacteriota bacterium]